MDSFTKNSVIIIHTANSPKAQMLYTYRKCYSNTIQIDRNATVKRITYPPSVIMNFVKMMD